MIGPLEIVVKDNIYFGCINIVYENGLKLYETNFLIIKIKIYRNKLLIIGRYKIIIFNLENKKIKYVNLKYFIGDAFLDENLYIATMCGKLIKNGKILEILEIKSIQFLKFCKDFILAGGYNKLLVKNYKIKTEDFIFENLHLGRVFDSTFNKFGFISAGEDRRVIIIDKNGLWTIQETRNYVIKCDILHDIVYTIDKNGVLKIYKNRKIIIEECFGKLCVQNAILLKNIFLVTFCNGLIKLINLSKNQNQKYDEFINMKNRIINKLIKKIKKFEYVEANDKLNETIKEFELLNIEIDKNINFEKNKLKKQQHQINYEIEFLKQDIVVCNKSSSNCEIDVDNEHEIFLILKKYDSKKTDLVFKSIICQNFTKFKTSKKYKICKNSVIIYKKGSVIKKIDVKKPNFYCNKSIGTKNGYLFYLDLKFKISKDPILYIKRHKQRFKIFTKSYIFYLIIINSNKFHKFYRPIENNFCFRIFTCVTHFKKYILAGTIENKIVLIFNEKIMDCLTVNGSVSAISCSKKSAYVVTKNGNIYNIKIVKKKLYIKYELENEFKITDCCFVKNLYFVDSNGNVKKLDRLSKKIILVKKFNIYLTKIKIMKNFIYVTTSKGILIIINEIKNYVVKYKVGYSAIQSLEIYKKNILLGLDTHKILKLNIEKIKFYFISNSSSFAKKIKYSNSIFILTDDYFLCEFNKHLKLLKKHEIYINNPNSFIIVNSICYVFGIGIQKIYLAKNK